MKGEISQITGSCEIIYVAFGYEYVLMAANSAVSARRYNPGITITLITNVKFNQRKEINEYFDRIIEKEMETETNRLIKTNIIDYSTCSNCLYLDSDTEIMGDLAPIYRCLENYDLALKMNPKPPNKDYEITNGVPGFLFPMWNGGVIFFKKCDRARSVFKDWHRIFNEMGIKSDQPSLARSIFENRSTRVLSLNSIWNTFPGELDLLKLSTVKIKSRIWHYRFPQNHVDVACRIQKHIGNIECCLTKTEQLKNQTENVKKKYAFLSSWAYRYSFTRYWSLKVLKILVKLGVLKEIDLERKKKRLGKRAARLSGTEL